MKMIVRNRNSMPDSEVAGEQACSRLRPLKPRYFSGIANLTQAKFVGEGLAFGERFSPRTRPLRGARRWAKENEKVRKAEIATADFRCGDKISLVHNSLRRLDLGLKIKIMKIYFWNLNTPCAILGSS
jgi:hypothetical protein